MTYDIDVDFLVFPLKNAEICSGKFTAAGEAESEPSISFGDAIFHLEKDIFFGPIHHPRQLCPLNRV